MAISDYSEPVAQLLNQGECSSHGVESWMDYQSLGLSESDRFSLIKMATDHDLYELDSEALEGWAPIHAWRALGQLQVAEAAEPLLKHANEYVDEEGWWDWMAMELPSVFAMIGASIIPDLAAVIQDRTRLSWARVIALDGLEAIAKRSQAEGKDVVYQQCVTILLEELSHFAENGADFNAFLIGALAELQVMEAVPLMEQAFMEGKVDEMMHGDWDEIQVQLGLKSREEVPRKAVDPRILRYLDSFDQTPSAPSGFGASKIQPSKSNRKSKQKQQIESRRKNRKRK
ncbi:hypothetical protein ACQ4M3_24445 [Leptolyngbya sp. AN03gr2]|uniref:hypothetical protein n=1 Tax=unclassified Leptolyngbya TaxID=2650499 RepID=UPI003D313A1E